MNVNINKLTTGLIAAVLALMVGLGLTLSANNNLKETVDNWKTHAEIANDSARYYKNKYGESVTQRQIVEAERDMLKVAYADDLTAIKQHLNINSKRVAAIYKLVTESSGSGDGDADTVTIIKEGVPVKALTVQDSSKWFSISGIAYPGKFTYNYTVRDSITIVPYREKGALYVKGVSANPNTVITGLEGVLVSEKERKKPWGIGPSIQIGYDTQIRITPGISVQYSLIRF